MAGAVRGLVRTPAPPRDPIMTRARTIAVVLLAAAALTAFWFEARTLLAMGALRPYVTTESAPWGGVSLQLAPTRDAVVRILRDWDHDVPEHGRTALALERDLLAIDRTFVAQYSLVFALVGLTLIAGLGASGRRLGYASLAWLLVVAGAAGFDTVENGAMAQILTARIDDVAAGVHDGAIRTMRLAAQLKFVLLLGETLWVLSALVMVIRCWWDPESMPETDLPAIAATAGDAFAAVTAGEAKGLGIGRHDRPRFDVGPSGEPWIRFRSADIFGLALSGGGIRSATFSLGILQGLDYLNVLSHVHYLSTVSGGGYIGGFWSAWRQRPATTALRAERDARGEKPPQFPRRERPDDETTLTEPGDPEEIRHLREFSRFLSPRIGFFETEMWNAIIAFVGGLLPSLAGTVSLVFLLLVAWLALNFPLACPEPWAAVLALVLLTGVTCACLEWSWYTCAAPEGRLRSSVQNLLATGAALFVVGVLQAYLPTAIHAVTGRWWPLLDAQWGWVEASGSTWPGVGAAHVAWWHGLMGTPGSDAVYGSLRLFDYPIVWLVTGGVCLVVRLAALMLVLGRGRKGVFLAAFDRLLMRLVGLALLWIGAATLWHIGMNLDRDSVWAAAGGAAATGGTFGMLRRWISSVFRQTPKATVLSRARPFLPQILAYLTIGLGICVLVSASAHLLGHDFMKWYFATAIAGALVVGTLHLDPAEYSLHAFYRDRICRAYIGASNEVAQGQAARNRAAEFRPGDDIPLTELLSSRPYHLVCCAANDLSGDQVATLSRGAKSATLSQGGVAIGGYQAAVPRMTLGAALTASAAAFNSAMGSISKRLGPAVGFLMAAMNLRLGIWVPHPAVRTARRRLLPGLLFYKELFGLTDATPASPDAARTDVHLSDGGHFENLALYELVRRHCRYVIVADCGEDLDVAFDDFGNAARRIREDFGVEIDIDLTPLAPNAAGCARQHVAVGTIHYDRRYDKGILVYLKPTLTGDEPPDVCQYHRRNSAFPHEPTTDQFYDEAQWESYRRLGVHTALNAFRFTERLKSRREGDHAADQIFTGARQEWWPTPPDLAQRVLGATDRFTRFEAEIIDRGADRLLAEVFPEVPAPRPAPKPDDAVRTMATLVEAAQVLEDIWLACDLETHWNHPLNLGWINAFSRWATAPSFKAWWPILGPMFSPGFQRFMRERFPVLGRRADGWICRSSKPADGQPLNLPPGLTTDWWTTRMGEQIVPHERMVFEYVMALAPTGQLNVQMGLVLASVDPRVPTRAVWTSEDFFVPPSLWGAGIGGAFLRDFLETLPSHGFRSCDVYIVNRRYEISKSQRTERIGFLEFYRGFGFEVVNKGNESQAGETLRGLLQLSSAGAGAGLDAWVQLRWTAPASAFRRTDAIEPAGAAGAANTIAPETPEA